MRAERSVVKAKSVAQKASVVFSARPARDSVRIVANEALLHHEAECGPTELITSISFASAEKPLLRKLCFVLQLISTFVSEYRLLNHQCYWFCLTIMRAVELEFRGAQITHHAGFKRAGTFLGIPIPRGSKALKKVHLGIRDLYKEGPYTIEPCICTNPLQPPQFCLTCSCLPIRSVSQSPIPSV